jgi:MFS family permease
MGLRQAVYTNQRGMSAGSKKDAVATLTASFALGLVFMSATIPTPLYPLYQKAFGLSGLTLALVYAVYALGNLAVLIVFGGLADRIGRRRTILAAVVLTLASAVTFSAATGVIWLFIGRFLSGLGTALAAGAATVWITDAQGPAAWIRRRTARKAEHVFTAPC